MNAPGNETDSLDLPAPPAPAGNYQAVVIHNGIGMVSGQVPFEHGRLKYAGRVGAELDPSEGRGAARLAARNALAQIDAALGGFECLAGLLRLEGFVASAADFLEQPAVLDGASDALIEVLGERGQHARAAFAVPRLPMDAAVELTLSFSVKPEE